MRGSSSWRTRYWGTACKADLVTVSVGGLKMRVEKRAHEAFLQLAASFDRHGYAVTETASGAYNCRRMKHDGKAPWSAHAYGLAVDVNPSKNPDGSKYRTDLPRSLVLEIVGLRTAITRAPVFRWGGDWDGRPETPHSYFDAMHFEIVATPAELREGLDVPAEPQRPKVAVVFEEGNTVDEGIALTIAHRFSLKPLDYPHKGIEPSETVVLVGRVAANAAEYQAKGLNVVQVRGTDRWETAGLANVLADPRAA